MLIVGEPYTSYNGSRDTIELIFVRSCEHDSRSFAVDAISAARRPAAVENLRQHGRPGNGWPISRMRAPLLCQCTFDPNASTFAANSHAFSDAPLLGAGIGAQMAAIEDVNQRELLNGTGHTTFPTTAAAHTVSV